MLNGKGDEVYIIINYIELKGTKIANDIRNEAADLICTLNIKYIPQLNFSIQREDLNKVFFRVVLTTKTGYPPPYAACGSYIFVMHFSFDEKKNS